MSVTTIQSEDGQVVTVKVSGRFDFAIHQDFQRAFNEFQPGEKAFVVDLGEAEYLDSSAMGMLLQLRDHASKVSRVDIVNSNETVREILCTANFDKLFNVG